MQLRPQPPPAAARTRDQSYPVDVPPSPKDSPLPVVEVERTFPHVIPSLSRDRHPENPFALGRRHRSMTNIIIRYKTKPESTALNAKLIEDVFHELNAQSPTASPRPCCKLTTIRSSTSSPTKATNERTPHQPAGVQSVRRRRRIPPRRAVRAQPPSPSSATTVCCQSRLLVIPSLVEGSPPTVMIVAVPRPARDDRQGRRASRPIMRIRSDT